MGRQTIPAPEKLSTKDKILDAAEELFAQRGYFGVSLRDITRLAGVELALANYHFGPKEELFRQVLARRADQHCSDCHAALDRAFDRAGDRPPSVEDLIEAFIDPAFDKLLHGGAGWCNYIRLLAQVSQLKHHQNFLQPLHHFYNPVVRRLIASLKLVLPGARDENIYWAYYFFYSALLHVLTASGEIDKISHGLCRAEDYARIRLWIVPYCTAGIYGVAGFRPPPAALAAYPNPACRDETAAASPPPSAARALRPR